MKKQNKKGIALSQSFGAVLTLILIATLVIIGIYMVVSLQDTFTNLKDGTTTLESIVMSSGIGYTANATLCNFAGYTPLVMNSTGGLIDSTGNYTVSASNGSITNLTDTYISPWLVNSTYNWGGPACTASATTVTQFATYPALVGLIGVIIFLGIVIGVLVASFAFGGRRGV